MKQLKTDDVYEFLKQQSTAVLSTASASGEPWGATVVFAVDEALHFYFMTRANTLKYQNIETNHHVAITVTDEATQTTVQASGVVERVAPEDVMDVVFHKLDKSKPHGARDWTAPVYKVHEGDYMVLRLKPSHLQYADFSQAATSANDTFIQQII